MKLKLWWSKGPTPGNFGDILTPFLFDYLNIQYTYSSIHLANAISIGSIAKFAKKDTIVLGSGTIRASDPLSPEADWRFVRGPLTREIVVNNGGDCPEIYGDPALLLPMICEADTKHYELGIVPHYVDYNEVVKSYPGHFVINLLNPNPLEVAKQISSCRKIISSSLHGIIAAHAYGIPAAWVEFSNKLNGDGIKFFDYYQSVKASCIKSSVSNPIYSVGQIDTTPILRSLCSL
jgi:pyruvyltransferase